MPLLPPDSLQASCAPAEVALKSTLQTGRMLSRTHHVLMSMPHETPGECPARPHGSHRRAITTPASVGTTPTLLLSMYSSRLNHFLLMPPKSASSSHFQ